jgi:hypothetical protein
MELLVFSRWVVLVRPGLLLKGVLVQESVVEKTPYFRFIFKYVGKTCNSAFLLIGFFYLVYRCGSIIWSTAVC